MEFQSWKINLRTEVCVDRYTSHVFFLMHLAHVITLTSWLKVSSVRISLHPHSIHDVTCLSVCCLFVFVSLVFISHFYFFSFTVYLFSDLLLPCRHRRGLMKSIAPWRYTILSQFVYGQRILRSQCSGSTKLRLLNQLMNL